ncbi:DUF1801 domain-containing protein [Saccharicrinis sp. FJH54]|uniref:DUF1801 domain-containing protein n=1 Tax=Saccharicrinis sp. FJH54 TaxID=3344665 RepID=UPI0035D48D14
MSTHDTFYFNSNEPNKSCLLALRSIILNQDVHITETVKYGMPCFCYKLKPFCYLWVDKKNDEPYILLTQGKLLSFPELESGNRNRMKILRVNPYEDIPVNRISAILLAGLDLFRKAD